MDRVSKSAKRRQADASTLPSPWHRMANRRKNGKQGKANRGAHKSKADMLAAAALCVYMYYRLLGYHS